MQPAEFNFIACVCMVSGLATLYWAANKGAYPWEVLTLNSHLLPVVSCPSRWRVGFSSLSVSVYLWMVSLFISNLFSHLSEYPDFLVSWLLKPFLHLFCNVS